MELDDVLHDREPQSKAPLGAGRRAVGLPESIEDEGKDVGADAAAGIRDHDIDARLRALQPHGDPPTLSRELDRVRQHVPERLLKTDGIAAERARPTVEPGVERDDSGFGHGGDDVYRRAQYLDEVNLARLDLQLAGDRARDVENVLDQTHLRASVAFDRVERLLGVDVGLAAQHRRPADDGVERSS